MVKSRKLKMTKSRKSRMNKSRKMRKSMNRKRVGGSGNNNITVRILHHFNNYSHDITIDADATVHELKVAYLNLVRDNPGKIFKNTDFKLQLDRYTLNENLTLSKAGIVDNSMLMAKS
jgi:hypothetical protein